MRDYTKVTWEELSLRRSLSPIIGLDAVTIKQAAEWIGVPEKKLTVPKTKIRQELGDLGMFVATGKQLEKRLGKELPRTQSGAYLMCTEDGGSIEAPQCMFTYLTAPAVARLYDEALSLMPEIGCQDDDPEQIENNIAVLTDGVVETIVFSDDMFGDVRGVEINGEPWLVGKDVAKALGYVNTKDAIIKHVDDEDKGVAKCDPRKSYKNCIMINESGMYSLVMSSHLPGAKKFKRWVTSEILPSIRKRGVYMTPETIEQVLSDPDLVIRLATQLKEERAAKERAEAYAEEVRQKNVVLDVENKALSRYELTWNPRQVLNRLIRCYASAVYGNNFKLAWNDYYMELGYRYGIRLKRRIGGENLLDRVRDDEWVNLIALAVALCKENCVDISEALNNVNVEEYISANNIG